MRALVLLAFALLGCPTPVAKHAVLYPLTGAPPARKLEVVNKEEKHAITVSSGVAFGVSIYDTCGNDSTPTLEIADATVVREHPLARNTSNRELLLVAERAGKTTVTVKAQCTVQAYEVTVLPQ